MIAKPKPTPRPKAKRRKKKTARQLLVRDLDAIIREIVFIRDAECVPLNYKGIVNSELEDVKPIKTNVPQLGHIISRARFGVRWDLRNCHKQDSGDNLLHEFYPEVYNQWYIKNFGLDSWSELVDDSRPVSKYSIDDLETLYIELVEIQKCMELENLKPYYSQKQIISGAWRNE